MRSHTLSVLTLLLASTLAGAACLSAAAATGDRLDTRHVGRPWLNSTRSADDRTRLLLAQMTRREKQTLVFGYFGTPQPDRGYVPPAAARPGSAGYVPGIPRLGIPAQWETDAGLGVATQVAAQEKRQRTALPSGIAAAATWNPALARTGGAMIGDEARRSGFNVILAGGANLLRDPRNGRNFEYAGEDPLLAGRIVGAEVAGIQSNHIISTVKHFAMNDQETGRGKGNSVIDDAAMRMSDLLAFQIAIEEGRPGAVMCSYNRVNGTHACENRHLLTDVLRRDWRFKGYVMSDWGANHSAINAANAGLDQDSGFPFDDQPYYGAPLTRALDAGAVSRAMLDRMAGAVLHAMFATGLFDNPPPAPAPIDYRAHAKISREVIEQGAVLLKNTGAVLPLSATTRSIVVVGGHADKGVLAGGGSSLVYPRGGNAVPGLELTSWPGPVMYYPSPPVTEIRARAPRTNIRFLDGKDRLVAAEAARAADVAVVFVTQWTGESNDTSIMLADDQDALVQAVANANPKTIVVAETGGPVLMPWASSVAAILETWYPGTSGGAAIADLLFGRTVPSGHLPATFPAAQDQLVRPGPIDPRHLKGADQADVVYSEGAAVGYKWFDKNNMKPMFPFGYGLSYTKFAFNRLSASRRGNTVGVQFSVSNTGRYEAMAVPQIYVSTNGHDWEAPKRLAGWQKIALRPGETKRVSLEVDPRLLAIFDTHDQRWKIAAGDYRIMLAHSAAQTDQVVTLRLSASTWPPMSS